MFYLYHCADVCGRAHQPFHSYGQSLCEQRDEPGGHAVRDCKRFDDRPGGAAGASGLRGLCRGTARAHRAAHAHHVDWAGVFRCRHRSIERFERAWPVYGRAIDGLSPQLVLDCGHGILHGWRRGGRGVEHGSLRHIADFDYAAVLARRFPLFGGFQPPRPAHPSAGTFGATGHSVHVCERTEPHGGSFARLGIERGGHPGYELRVQTDHVFAGRHRGAHCHGCVFAHERASLEKGRGRPASYPADEHGTGGLFAAPHWGDLHRARPEHHSRGVYARRVRRTFAFGHQRRVPVLCHRSDRLWPARYIGARLPGHAG